MQDFLLILMLLATFAFGYFVMVRLDAFFDENQRLIEQESRQNRDHIRIAAESVAMLHSIAEPLEECSAANPYLEFFPSTGKAEHILRRLSQGTLDIALLTRESAAHIESSCAAVKIPYRPASVMSQPLGLPVENMDDDEWVYVVWNQSIPSKNRDRVVFALEAAYCTLKCGYADYLD